MLDSLLLLNSLSDATKILHAAGVATVRGSEAVWMKLHNAKRYLNEQTAELLAPPAEDDIA